MTPIRSSAGPAPFFSEGRLPWIMAFAAAAAVILFAALTNSAWEDYYITFRSSQNLVDGNGLVYQPGERLHTFTSPLGVLLPALTYALTGSAAGALWLFRVVSALALGASAWVLARALVRQTLPRSAVLIAAALGIFQVKTIEFSSNGMETALLVLFATLALGELTRPGPVRVAWLAAAYAGLMWTRPDAFVLAGGLTLGALVFSPAEERRARTLAVARAAAGGLLLYLPWLLWAWSYYGSPIPQTIIAKSALAPGRHFAPGRLLLAPLRALVESTPLTETFAPAYHQAQAWGKNFETLWAFFARAACLVWLWPAAPRVSRAASLALLVGGVYLQQIMPYPWYFGPWTALGGVALAGLFHRGWRATPAALRVGAAIAICLGLGMIVAGARTARVRQAMIEESVRSPIGLWLKENALPGQTVFLEPIGYIGYHATERVKLLDFPGLTSREVTAAISAGDTSYRALIARLHPDWLVLRPVEIVDQKLNQDGALDGYVLRTTFSCFDTISATPWLPGREALLFDSSFMVFERRRASP